MRNEWRRSMIIFEFVTFILIVFWPIWLGVLFVIILAKSLKVTARHNQNKGLKFVMYTGVILITSFLSFIWVIILVTQIPMAFAYIGSHGMLYPDGFEENKDLIHQELWFRMFLPPMAKECFSPDEICAWADGVMEISSRVEIDSTTRAKQWLEYISAFIIYGLPVGLCLGWLLNRLIKYRLSKQPVPPT